MTTRDRIAELMARSRELESRIEGMIEPYSDEQKRIAELETALRNIDDIINAALAGL